MSRLTLALILSVPLAPAFGAPQDTEESTQELMQQARGFLQNEDFKSAAGVFRKVVAEDKDNALAWQLLGYSLHMGGDLDAAIKAHEKASEFNQTRGIAFYNLGCAYALKGKKDRAFGYLNRSVRARFGTRDRIEDDTDLDSLRRDIRYQRLLARADGDSVTDDFVAKDVAGRWVMLSETRGGKKVEKPEAYIDVSAKSFVSQTPDGREGPVPYKMDTSTLTPTITLGDQAKGIVRLNGDEMTICLNARGGTAPKKFESTADNGCNIIVVRRAVTADRIQGRWEYVSGNRAGQSVDLDRLVGEVRVTAKTFTLPASAAENFVMKYSITSERKLDTVDFEIQSGPVPEGKALGILRVQGDTLTLCYDPTGQKRPTSFKPTADNGQFMFVLKRKAAQAK